MFLPRDLRDHGSRSSGPVGRRSHDYGAKSRAQSSKGRFGVRFWIKVLACGVLIWIVFKVKNILFGHRERSHGKQAAFDGMADFMLPFEFDVTNEGVQSALSDARAKRQTNSTLDFGKIYVINMDHRHDRRDNVTLIASVTGLDVEFVPGFRIESREQLRIGFPPYIPADIPLSKMAVYRAHANVWRTFLQQGHSATALILEDDVDWDINVKKVVSNMQAPLEALVKRMANDSSTAATTAAAKPKKKTKTNLPDASQPPTWNPASWDILRLGTCRDEAHSEQEKAKGVELDAVPYVIYNDENVPSREWTTIDEQTTFDDYGIPMPSSALFDEERDEKRHEGPTTRLRLIQKSNYPICMHAYAISRRGAAKLLAITSTGIMGANDLTVAQATQQGRLRSFTVLPSLFGQWKTQAYDGNSENDPENQNTHPIVDPDTPLSFSWNLKHSVRTELDDIIDDVSTL